MSGRERAPFSWLRALRYAVVAGALLVAGFAAGLYTAYGRKPVSKRADLGPAPHYTLTNQWGRKVSSTAFAGKVRVVTFLFPYCTTYCPLITAHLIGFEHDLVDSGLQNRVEIVAFNVAPGAVGPKQMREFLAQYGWNPKDPRWQFLTGTPAAIRKVVTGGYHVSYQRVADSGDEEVVTDPGQTPQLTVANPLAERVKPNYDITHNDAIEIVGPKGRVRKIYDQGDTVSGDALLSAITPLLKSAPPRS